MVAGSKKEHAGPGKGKEAPFFLFAVCLSSDFFVLFLLFFGGPRKGTKTRGGEARLSCRVLCVCVWAWVFIAPG